MKKAIALIVSVLLLAALLAACTPGGNETPATSTEAPTDVPTETPTEPTTGCNLKEPPYFTFTRENFPRMDGSTSMVPMGEAIASVLLGESRDEVADLVQFNRTTQSFRNLMWGSCDILIVGEPNAAVYDEMDEAGFKADIETIATDGLIFVVNENNPVDNLTTEQVRGIYTGQITNWSQVGGNDEEIIPFQRNEGAGSQALMKKLVMGDTALMDPPTEYVIGDMAGLMSAVKSYDNSANAIGYSVYYYAHDMEMAQGLKILSIDGVKPTAETIRDGEYPHRNAYYCVVPADAAADSPNRILYDWLMTEEGQRLLNAEGYVSVMDFGN